MRLVCLPLWELRPRSQVGGPVHQLAGGVPPSAVAGVAVTCTLRTYAPANQSTSGNGGTVGDASLNFAI